MLRSLEQWSTEMTPEQHAQRIRQLELQLEIADYGMGMPRDYERVMTLRMALEWARKEAARSDGFNEQAGGY